MLKSLQGSVLSWVGIVGRLRAVPVLHEPRWERET